MEWISFEKWKLEALNEFQNKMKNSGFTERNINFCEIIVAVVFEEYIVEANGKDKDDDMMIYPDRTVQATDKFEILLREHIINDDKPLDSDIIHIRILDVINIFKQVFHEYRIYW